MGYAPRERQSARKSDFASLSLEANLARASFLIASLVGLCAAVFDCQWCVQGR